MNKTLQQIFDEEREKSGINKLTNQQIAVKISNSDRYRSPEERQKMSESYKLYRQENPYTDQQRQRIGDAMRGKTLEEMLGPERAAAGREARRQSNFKQDYTGRGPKIAATRRAKGSYDGRSMKGREHKESTKNIMAIKARVRQDLKRELGLGRNDKISKELLEERYKKLGL